MWEMTDENDTAEGRGTYIDFLPRKLGTITRHRPENCAKGSGYKVRAGRGMLQCTEYTWRRSEGCNCVETKKRPAKPQAKDGDQLPTLVDDKLLELRAKQKCDGSLRGRRSIINAMQICRD